MAKRTLSSNPATVEKFNNVELRIGNADESDKGLSQFTENQLVSIYPSPSSTTFSATATFVVPSPVNGRYLTLQILDSANLEIKELWVFSVR